MSKFLFGVIALVALLIAIVVVAPMLIPVSAYKGRIETAASNALGRKVTIGEDLSFRLVPTTAFHVSNLEIANAEGFSAPYLVKVKSADIGVKLFPLFAQKVEVERFVLDAPEINLERAKDGRINWDLVGGQSAPAPKPGDAPQGGNVRALSLGDVAITNGKASYADAAAGKKYALGDINVSARLNSMSEPLEVHGAMTFEGAAMKVDLVLASLQKLVDKKAANLKLDLALGQTTAGVDLVVNTASGLSYSGPVSFNAPDLPAFAKLLGTPLEDSPGFDKFSVEGSAQGGETRIALSSAKINFDAIDAQGDLAVDLSGARPKATGQLSTDDLDLRPYLPPAAAESGTFPTWSKDKLDFGALRNIDADFNLSADSIELNNMKFSESRLRVQINNGVMTASIPQLGVYGGSGSGTLTVDARKGAPVIVGKFDVASVEAQPFSKDLLRTDRLLGAGGFNLTFRTEGASQAALMDALSGSGGFEIADGAIKGVNLAKLVRTVGSIQKGGINPASLTSAITAAQSPAEQTDFSDFASQFSIASGVVTASRISLTGPYLTMSGGGAVNLPAQSIDLKLAPKASTSEDNKTGQTFTVPLRVTGSFAQPKLGVDIEALLGGSAADAVKGLFDQLGGKNSGSAPGAGGGGSAAAAIGAVLNAATAGKPANPGDATNPPATGPALPADALKQLLKPKKPAEPAQPAPAPDDKPEPEKTPQ